MDTDFSEITALSAELTNMNNHEKDLLYEKKLEQKEIEDRKTQLIEGLAKTGLKLRERSVICEHYIHDIPKTEYTPRKYELSRSSMNVLGNTGYFHTLHLEKLTVKRRYANIMPLIA